MRLRPQNASLRGIWCGFGSVIFSRDQGHGYETCSLSPVHYPIPAMKKLLRLSFPLGIIAVLLCSCNTPSKMNALLSSWEGKNVNDLIASWGPPTQTMSDGSGGQILIYDQSRTIVLPGSSTTTTNYNGTTNGNVYATPGYANYNQNTSGTANSYTTYNPPTPINISRQRMFWANSDGTIYRWSWKGL